MPAKLLPQELALRVPAFQEAEDAAVQAIGSAFHNADDVAAVDVTELRVGVGGDDAHLVKRIRAGVVADGVVEVFVNFLAVEQGSCSIADDCR